MGDTQEEEEGKMHLKKGSCTPVDPMSLSLLLVSLNLNFVTKINVSVSVLLLWKIKQEQYSARRPQKSCLW